MFEELSQGFGFGSIIGCGYEPLSKTVFFTHEGIRFDQRSNVKGILYPSIAANGNWRVSINTGNTPFYYKPANAF
jgi:hypothetical protein